MLANAHAASSTGYEIVASYIIRKIYICEYSQTGFSLTLIKDLKEEFYIKYKLLIFAYYYKKYVENMILLLL